MILNRRDIAGQNLLRECVENGADSTGDPRPITGSLCFRTSGSSPRGCSAGVSLRRDTPVSLKRRFLPTWSFHCRSPATCSSPTSRSVPNRSEPRGGLSLRWKASKRKRLRSGSFWSASTSPARISIAQQRTVGVWKCHLTAGWNVCCVTQMCLPVCSSMVKWSGSSPRPGVRVPAGWISRSGTWSKPLAVRSAPPCENCSARPGS